MWDSRRFEQSDLSSFTACSGHLVLLAGVAGNHLHRMGIGWGDRLSAPLGVLASDISEQADRIDRVLSILREINWGAPSNADQMAVRRETQALYKSLPRVHAALLKIETQIDAREWWGGDGNRLAIDLFRIAAQPGESMLKENLEAAASMLKSVGEEIRWFMRQFDQ